MSKSVKAVTETNRPILETAFNRLFVTDILGLTALYGFMITPATSWTDIIQTLFTKASDCINSVRAYPIIFTSSNCFSVQDTSTSELTILNQRTGCSVKSVSVPYATYNMGSVTISEHFNNFMDYEPYTKIQLFLPYLGFIDLPVNEVMGKTLSIRYTIDFHTGMCTAFILTGTGENEVLIAEKDGKIGIDINIGRADGREITKNLLSTGIGSAGSVLSLVGGISQLNPNKVNVNRASAIMGGGSILKGVNSIMNSVQMHVQRGEVGVGATGLSAPQNCYLIIQRPNKVTIDSYNSIVGKPCGKTKTLGNISGFTIVDKIHLEGFTGATREEINEIENLLLTGVHL